ncbi:general substrate transporter [Xylogone sp. PMI_703]|nr:general substrate transporter [Xylogone sp. PMI_703]
MDPMVPSTIPALTVSEVLGQQDKSGLGLTPALIKLYLVLTPATLVVCATNGYDGSVLTGLQGIDEWKNQFGNPNGALLGITSAAYALGAIASTFFSSVISDSVGRRWPIFIGSIIMMVGVVMQCVSKSIGLFIGGRIVVGFGISLALAAAPVLISELAHPRHRVFFTAMYNCSFSLGSVLAAWVAYGAVHIPNSWAWRLPTLLQAAPALIQTSAIWFLDESPRWLCYKDRGDEAFAILVKHHGDGDPNHPMPIAEYHEMCVALLREKEMRHKGLRLFLQTPANRKRLFILVTLAVFGQWSGLGLISYYLTKILSSIGIEGQQEQTRLNGIVTTVSYATSVMAVILATKVGRRVLFVGGGIFMWLSLVGFTIAIAVYNEKGTVGSSRASLGLIFIFNSAYNFCLIPMIYLYSTEILPYRLRAMGLSISVFSTKASLFFNQFVNPIGLGSLGWKYYLVYVVWVAIEVLTMYLVYPETRGHSLETMPEVFGEHVLDGMEDKILGNNDADLVEVGGVDAKGVNKTVSTNVEQVEDIDSRATGQ